MPLLTGLDWIDRDLGDSSSCYLHCDREIIRRRLLRHILQQQVLEGQVLLLSFKPPDGGRWSFDPEQVFHPMEPDRRDRVAARTSLHRASSKGSLLTGSWTDLEPADHDTLIVESASNVLAGSTDQKLHTLLLERLDRLMEPLDTFFIDPRKPARALQQRTDIVMELDWQDGAPVKTITGAPGLDEARVEQVRTDGQLTLTRFAPTISY